MPNVPTAIYNEPRQKLSLDTEEACCGYISALRKDFLFSEQVALSGLYKIPDGFCSVEVTEAFLFLHKTPSKRCGKEGVRNFRCSVFLYLDANLAAW